MKILHINIDDSKGGASIACQSINSALNSIGVDSSVLVQKKFNVQNKSNEIVDNRIRKFFYFIRFALDYISIYLLTVKQRGRFSFPYWGVDITKHKLVKKADVIHLHWINGGFISIKTFRKLSKSNKPIVWTLHDMWAFTGGCHYAGTCDNYKNQCNNCPSLKFHGINDYSSRIFKNKIDVYKILNLNIVTCSNWLAGCAGDSTLFKKCNIKVIPNPIDINLFKPLNKITSRENLNLPVDKFIILFGTMNLKDKRKGFSILIESLKLLYNEFPEVRPKLEIAVFGSLSNQNITLPFKTNFLGKINEINKIVECYNSADVFVAPSIEDNLPNTVMESLACGTPVAAFDIGGIPDMVDHKQNGFLAKKVNADELKTAIRWFIDVDKTFKDSLSYNARKKVVDNYNPIRIANSYLTFYQEILSS